MSLIKEMRNLKYPVAFLLTKIDEMSPEEIDSLKGSIRPKLPVFCLSNHSLIKQDTSVTDWKKLEKWTLGLPVRIRKKENSLSSSYTSYSGYSSCSRKNCQDKSLFNPAKFILRTVRKVIFWW